MRRIVIYSLLLLVLQNCKKDTSNAAPVIKFISISATEVVQYKDSLEIKFEYSDANGDLGEINPDQNAIYVKDRRLSKPDYYFIPPLSPPTSSVFIRGELIVKIKNTFLLGTALQETTNFEVKLKDRSGQWSNTIVTPEITIKK
jgi:hypothetical protein